MEHGLKQAALIDIQARRAPLTHGLMGPRFESFMEARYLQERAPIHARQLEFAAWLLFALFNGMVLGDWLMAADQFDAAWRVRLTVYVPVALAGLVAMRMTSRTIREWVFVAMGGLPAAITAWICWRSSDPLSGPHLAALALILLSCGCAYRLRFWIAAASNALICLVFIVGALAKDDMAVAILVPSAIMLLALMLFNLYGCYRLERDDRANWFFLDQEAALIREMQASNQSLDELSRFDALTGLANRRYFESFLAQVWSRCSRDGRPVSLLMFDVDHFKAYNDRYGHPAGDACLQAIAAALDVHLRKPFDLVARLGGEEFAAVLSDTDEEAARKAGERVCQSIAALKLPHECSPTADQVTVSIGVACADPRIADATTTQLLAQADAALYESKRSGRNRVSVYMPEPSQGQGRSAEPAEVRVDRHDAPLDDALHCLGVTKPLPPSDASKGFSRTLERAYLKAHTRRALRAWQFSGGLALLVYLLFLPVDVLLVPDVLPLAIWIRVGMFLPVLLALLVVPISRPQWIVRFLPTMGVDLAVMVGALAASASLAAIMLVSHAPLKAFYHAGFMVILAFGNVVQRMRWRFAVSATLAVMAMQVTLILLPDSGDKRLLLALTMLVAASGIHTLMAAYAIESDERTSYLLQLRRKQLLAELGETQGKLETLSRVDPLTGLFNRRHFQDFLDQTWQRALHDGTETGLILLDVDHFKPYNDGYGHLSGDRCLKQVANALKENVRAPGDLLARFGGEEFVVVLPRTDASTARAVAERLRQSVEALRLPHAHGNAGLVVSISAGVTCINALASTGPADLIAASDQALYRAKRAGRNRVSI